MTGVPHDCTEHDPTCPRCAADELTPAERSAQQRRERARAHLAAARRILHPATSPEDTQ